SIKFHMLRDSATCVSASTTFCIFHLLVRLVKKAHLLRCAPTVSLQFAYGVWLIAYGSDFSAICHQLSAICEVRAPRSRNLFDHPAIEFGQELFLRNKAQIN